MRWKEREKNLLWRKSWRLVVFSYYFFWHGFFGTDSEWMEGNLGLVKIMPMFILQARAAIFACTFMKTLLASAATANQTLMALIYIPLKIISRLRCLSVFFFFLRQFWFFYLYTSLPFQDYLKLTFSRTSPGFYMSAVQVFWKHWRKRRNFS